MLVNITQGLVVATVIPLAEVIAGTRPADAEAMQAAVARQAALTKPPGSLGRLEELSVQIAGIQGTEQPVIRGKRIIVAAGDHGVVARGVTAYPQEVTAQMVMNFLSGGAAINVLARHAGVELVIVDAGVAAPLPEHADLRVLGVGRGTGDITVGPAMTRLQAEACVAFGVGLALEAAERRRRGRDWHGRHGHREHHGVKRNHRGADGPSSAGDHGAGHGTHRR